MTKSILIYSYYTNMPGACQAEWIDDRMFAFIEKGHDITLVSATCCFTHTHEQITHIKAPALSPHAARYEYEEIHRRKIPVKKNFTYAYLKLIASIDTVLERLHIRSGEGRWSWFLTSLIASFRVNTIRNSSFVYTTGGPASAHLTGIFMAKLFGKKVICEFQDPLSGKDIGRNRLSHAGLQFFEKQIIRYADCTIYCTKSAMEYTREKYRVYRNKIFFVYPGSNKPNYNNIKISKPNQKLNITYLGSLYQTRNFGAIILAVDAMTVNDIYNLGYGEEFIIRHFADTICTIMGMILRKLNLILQSIQVQPQNVYLTKKCLE